MKRLFLLIFSGLFFLSGSRLQSRVGHVRYNGIDVDIPISYQSIDSLKKSLTLLKENECYKKAWTLGTISELYLTLSAQQQAQEYYLNTCEALKKISADSICLFSFDMERLIQSEYDNFQNGTNLDIPIGFNDLAIEALPNSDFVDIDWWLVHLLTNNAASAWKYDFSKGYGYFENLSSVATPIILRNALNPNKEDLSTVKDPVRRYVRFMYNLYYSSNSKNKLLCKQFNCLEKGWHMTQLLKSRIFKSDMLNKEVMSLDSGVRSTVIRNITFLDSMYSAPLYFKKLIQSNFIMDSTCRHLIDNKLTQIIAEIPNYSSLFCDQTTQMEIQGTLADTETYISIVYTDNNRNAYAWKIDKVGKPQLIKIGMKSLELFLRIEYFRDTKIGHQSLVVLDGDSFKTTYDLKNYASERYKIQLNQMTNDSTLFNKLIVPLNLKIGNRIIFEIDQNLSSFPIGLITDQRTHKLLLEENSFVYTPSASVFYYLRNKRLNYLYKYDYVGYSYNSYPSFVDSVIEKSAMNFPNSKIFVNCTESQVYSSDSIFRLSRYAHFACHHNIIKSSSGLDFARDSQCDGNISGSEISRNLTNNADLVVMTSCSTSPFPDDYAFLHIEGVADNKYLIDEYCVCSIGETFSDVTSSFFAAGTHKMLVTQWVIVDSDLSVSFMNTFFYCVSSGETPDNALKISQEKFYKQGIAPVNWAGYILVGD